MPEGFARSRPSVKLHLSTSKLALAGVLLGLMVGVDGVHAQGTAQGGAAASVAANAQPVAPVAPTETAGVQDIIVTAQRRVERLQDTPVSITALSSTALEARGITNLQDVSNFAPNLEMHPTNRPAGGGSAFAGYIRGGHRRFPVSYRSRHWPLCRRCLYCPFGRWPA
jgi:iron complex outermembrane receptor protein